MLYVTACSIRGNLYGEFIPEIYNGKFSKISAFNTRKRDVSAKWNDWKRQIFHHRVHTLQNRINILTVNWLFWLKNQIFLKAFFSPPIFGATRKRSDTRIVIYHDNEVPFKLKFLKKSDIARLRIQNIFICIFILIEIAFHLSRINLHTRNPFLPPAKNRENNLPRNKKKVAKYPLCVLIRPI